MRISLACLVALCARTGRCYGAGRVGTRQTGSAAALSPTCPRTMIILSLLTLSESNYLLYTWTSDLNKEAIRSYDWAENARKDEVGSFQLSLAFPLWRGILGDNSLLGASYTQKSWWQPLTAKSRRRFTENQL